MYDSLLIETVGYSQQLLALTATYQGNRFCKELQLLDYRDKGGFHPPRRLFLV